MGLNPDVAHMCTLGCAAYVFLHEGQCHDALSPHAELMTFIGYADGIKGWKFMRSTNIIFYATKAVFNESTFLHCPGGSRASIPAIETGLLLINEDNIPLEDDDQTPVLLCCLSLGICLTPISLSLPYSCLIVLSLPWITLWFHLSRIP